MLSKKIIASLCAVPLLTGCESMMQTMFTHYKLPEGAVLQVAQLNAVVNICLAKNLVDKNVAYAFSSVGARYLDVGVFDRDFYQNSYQKTLAKVQAQPDLNEGCAQVERSLPAITKQYADSYTRMASNLAATNAQERQQMATMLGNFGNNWNQPNYAMTYSWPTVQYVETQSSSNLYLVNTSKGLVQCRTTSKSYVFCM